MEKKILFIAQNCEAEIQYVDLLSHYFEVEQSNEEMISVKRSLDREKPDVIVMDIHGFETEQSNMIMALKENTGYGEIPIVGYGDKADYAALEFHIYSPFQVSMHSPVDETMLLTAVCNQLKVAMPVFDGKQYVPEQLHEIKRKVLVVDDNAMMLRTIKTMLDDKYKVTLANSGMMALTSIGRERPDVILLDYEMPVCDGRMTLQMLRENPETSEIPVYILTGVAEKDKIEAILKLRPQGYILKPPSSEKLLTTLEREFTK